MEPVYRLQSPIEDQKDRFLIRNHVTTPLPSKWTSNLCDRRSSSARFNRRLSWLWLMLAIVSSAPAWAHEPAVETTPADKSVQSLPGLAVLVHEELDGKELTQLLRPLLEAEISNRYEGTMLERAELASLLEEMKLSALLGDATKDGGPAPLQTGGMDKAACLVVARVSPRGVHVTVTGFPKTDILFEGNYNERLEPDSLAERIAGDTLGAIRSQGRDSKLPYVSIGSFYCLDPHRRFLDFSRAAEAELRKQLSEGGQIRLVERMFPSDLLNEFNLARAGMTVTKITDFNAPPADLLIYGECTAQQNQDLNNPGILLDCTIKVISPTDLLPSTSVTVACRSDDVAPLVSRAKALLLETEGKAHARLGAGAERGFSTQEFESFKKQAFRLMPEPPHADGTFFNQNGYNGPHQSGSREEIERALRMLECAALFNGSDTTVLTCTGAILDGLARHARNDTKQQAALRDASMELIERAYRIDSNWNTRGFYRTFGLDLLTRQEKALLVARHIIETRSSEPWQQFVLDAAMQIVAASDSNPANQVQLLLDTVGDYEKRPGGLAALTNQVRSQFTSSRYVVRTGGRPTPGRPAANEGEKLAKQADAAGRFMASKHPYPQALGRWLKLDVISRTLDKQADANLINDFISQMRIAMDLPPQLYEKYGDEFLETRYGSNLGGLLTQQRKRLADAGLEEQLAALQEQFVTTEMKAHDYNCLHLGPALQLLVPKLVAAKREADARAMVEEFMANNSGGGEGPRMELTRFLNGVEATQNNRPILTLDQLTAIAFDDGESAWVSHLTPSKIGLLGIRSKRVVNETISKVWRLSPGATQATILKQVTASRVYDVAANDRYILAGAEKEGLFLLDIATMQARQLTPANSALPGATVKYACDVRDDFYIGIADKDNYLTHLYRLSPGTGQLTDTGTILNGLPDTRLKEGTEEQPVVEQTGSERTLEYKGKRITFQSSGNLAEKNNFVLVFPNGGEDLLNYRGQELTNVHDMTMWRDYLIFATANGLYVTKPGTNRLQCIVNEAKLYIHSCYPVGDSLYLGTSKGLYALTAQLFATVVKEE